MHNSVPHMSIDGWIIRCKGIWLCEKMNGKAIIAMGK